MRDPGPRSSRARSPGRGRSSTRGPRRSPGSCCAPAFDPGRAWRCSTAPSAAAVATLHAIARVGGVAAPLGPGLTPSELAVAGEVIAPDLVIHDPSLEGSARSLGGPLRSLDDLTGPSPRSDTPDALAPPPLPSPDPAAPAVIVLTSGTTGRPKAVVLSTAALVASAEAWLAALPEATGWLLAVGLGACRRIGRRLARRPVGRAVGRAGAPGPRGHPGRVGRRPPSEPRLARADRPDPPARPRSATSDRRRRSGPCPSVAARSRRPRPARDRGRLAGRADVRPVRGRLGGDRFADRRGGDPSRTQPGGRCLASRSASPGRTPRASVRSRSPARRCSAGTSATRSRRPRPGPMTAGCGPATSAGSTPMAG